MSSGEVFILWSGGKDSYLSFKKATSRGLEVTHAISYVDRRSGRLIGCYLRESLVREQVKSLGLDFVPVYGSKRRGDFIKNLRSTLLKLRSLAGVFGDIHQKEHRALLERVCGEIGVRAVFPLWHVDERVVIREALTVSEPLVVCRRVRKVPPRFLGRVLDNELLSYLDSVGLSLSGEGGEYQTFVATCEEFKLKLNFGRRFRRSYYECIDLEVG